MARLRVLGSLKPDQFLGVISWLARTGLWTTSFITLLTLKCFLHFLFNAELKNCRRFLILSLMFYITHSEFFKEF